MAASLCGGHRRQNPSGLAPGVAFAAPGITFVKPDLLRHLSALERLGLHFEFRRLGNDVFNELGWLDPSGHLIRLVEARTFSPSKRPPTDTSLCGYFLEIATARGRAATAAKDFWEKLGFVGIDELDAPPAACLLHQRLDRPSGCTSPRTCRGPRCCSTPATSAAPWRGWPRPASCPRGQVPAPLRQLPAPGR